MLHLRLPAPGLFLSIQAQDFIEEKVTAEGLPFVSTNS